VNEPTRIAGGAPDYVIDTKDKNLPLGYIEAKDIGVLFLFSACQGNSQIIIYLC
jgi:hypothetical protein